MAALLAMIILVVSSVIGRQAPLVFTTTRWFSPNVPLMLVPPVRAPRVLLLHSPPLARRQVMQPVIRRLQLALQTAPSTI